MALWQNLVEALIFREPKQEEPFELLAHQEPGHLTAGGAGAAAGEGKTAARDGKSQDDEDKQERREEQITIPGGTGKKRLPRKPTRVVKDGLVHSEAPERAQMELSPSLQDNLELLYRQFNVPLNQDLITREFTLGTAPPVRATALFLEGMVDSKLQTQAVFQPLMLLSELGPRSGESGTLLERVARRFLPGNDVRMAARVGDVVEGIAAGRTAILVEGAAGAILVETIGFEHRGVEKPTNQRLVRGPQEAFNETLKVNTALVRRLIRSEHLITERFRVGKRNRQVGALMYLDNLANPALIKEIRKRIQGIDTDLVLGSGMLEQMIEDNPWSFLPQALTTERPDQVAATLLEGRVAIFLEGTPDVLVIPATMWTLFHTPESYYLRAPMGTFLRFVRLIALIISVLLPAVYISVAAFHHEMIPTDLLLSVAANREKVPFPSILEVLILEVSWEIIREAGVRIPGLFGPTLGIVGAIILGQAAVSASLASPVVIVVIALTGISAFAIPDYSLQFAFRLHRFIFTLMATGFGFLGIGATLFAYLNIIANVKSFGVPYLAPVGPLRGGNPDLIFRGMIWEQEVRPYSLYPQDRRRQPRVSEKWLLRRPGPEQDSGEDQE